MNLDLKEFPAFIQAMLDKGATQIGLTGYNHADNSGILQANGWKRLVDPLQLVRPGDAIVHKMQSGYYIRLQADYIYLETDNAIKNPTALSDMASLMWQTHVWRHKTSPWYNESGKPKLPGNAHYSEALPLP